MVAKSFLFILNVLLCVRIAFGNPTETDSAAITSHIPRERVQSRVIVELGYSKRRHLLEIEFANGHAAGSGDEIALSECFFQGGGCRRGGISDKRVYEYVDEGRLPSMWAADVTMIPLDEVKKFKQARQNAKAVNFGVPGGLGAKSLVEYARSTYKVEMDLDQATAKRTKFRSPGTRSSCPCRRSRCSQNRSSIMAATIGIKCPCS